MHAQLACHCCDDKCMEQCDADSVMFAAHDNFDRC